jgi:hypothetical protein
MKYFLYEPLHIYIWQISYHSLSLCVMEVVS